MATDTENLLQENPSKTLGPDAAADSKASLKNRLQEDTSKTTTPLSSTDVSATTASSKESEEMKAGGSTNAATPVASSPTNATTVTDIQKKIRRAERFGMPVQLSEEEKRNSRAERYMMIDSVYGLCGFRIRVRRFVL